MISLVGGELYQWDTGRIVKVIPDSDVIVHEVHFSTKAMDFAYVVKTYIENSVTYCAIPNIILQQSNRVLCYEVCENSDGEETIYDTQFEIIKRNRPEDYIYTEHERITIEDLDARIDTVSSNAFTAKNAADAAQSTADTALGLANNAVSNIQYGGTIYWDGNTESRPHIYWSSMDFYRVSDLYVPYDQFNGSYIGSNTTSTNYTINKLKLVNEAYYVRKSSSDVFAILIIPFAGTYEEKNGLGVEKLFDAQYPGIYFSKVSDVYVQSVTLNNEKNPYKIYCDVSNGLNTTKSISVDNTTIKLNDQGQLTLALSNANEVSF